VSRDFFCAVRLPRGKARQTGRRPKEIFRLFLMPPGAPARFPQPGNAHTDGDAAGKTKNALKKRKYETVYLTLDRSTLIGGHISPSLNLPVNLKICHLICYLGGNNLIRAGKLLNLSTQFFCPLVICASMNRIHIIIARYRFGKQLDRLLSIARPNQANGQNVPGCFSAVRTLHRLHHLLNGLSRFVLCMTVPDIPAYHRSKQQRDSRCNQCFHRVMWSN